MHILFIGYGKTSCRVAKQLFEQGHQITTISQSPKTDEYATHLVQEVHQLNLAHISPIDWVYVLLSPNESTSDAYQRVYVDSVQPISNALKQHPVQKVVVVSSTRVYGENHGERIDDESVMKPNDEQGRLLLKMEQLWQQAYPSESIIIRPTGIYGTSVARMLKLAEKTKSYPNRHWSNRIYIDDLASFLAHLLHVEHAEKSYIVSNNQPSLLHETIQWFQRQLNLPELVLQSDEYSGKRIYATRMAEMGFQLQHKDCFEDYLEMLGK
ncbi:NAD-dependent epimerase/dehydratase family protein [Acinetobacter bohemicus]|uniref:Nucleoside-diphosphate-sugar epimerase n=1 Tax=Acinetobacter bohemicus TaxID=1435036 RepID=A0A1I6TWG3_9GAMM|nr:sugar nucleotide-binding protein [Acinetobacter bohemicus]KAB0652295.1 NAD-dependent epimerase/dehydratase family protein [Acinetobacter bohemicus]SFS93500.1 Nucleoside-diphosphate-sugar epimerase [Acinetobacter bohemicus]